MPEPKATTRTIVEVTTKETHWKRIETCWQLPCGCIGADIWHSLDVEQSECSECGRGWWHMSVKANHCVMLDGEPQGPPVLILTEKMKITD